MSVLIFKFITSIDYPVLNRQSVSQNSQNYESKLSHHTEHCHDHDSPIEAHNMTGSFFDGYIIPAAAESKPTMIKKIKRTNIFHPHIKSIYFI